jgi:gamma-glutamylcyclotransferase (GGCT)/AIG2-like uncharacterized protein YtfP
MESLSGAILLFVYGTLRRKGVRDIMRRFPQVQFVAAAQVHGHLYDLGTYPGLIVDATGPAVIGELYAVDAATLHALDAIEGVSVDDPAARYYVRRRVVVWLPDAAETEGWVYELNWSLYPQAMPIRSGDWIKHAKTKTAWPVDA